MPCSILSLPSEPNPPPELRSTSGLLPTPRAHRFQGLRIYLKNGEADGKEKGIEMETGII